jgi:hypothetical protein
LFAFIFITIPFITIEVIQEIPNPIGVQNDLKMEEKYAM